MRIQGDALSPVQMARKAEEGGIRKAALPFPPLFASAVLAGAFIGLGAMFSTTVAAGTSSLPYGIVRLLTGMAFSLGLILIVVGGAELFTGNNLMVISWATGKIGFSALLRSWAVVYFGNFVGSLSTAFLVFLAKQYGCGGGAVGEAALRTAVSKVSLEFGQAIALGMLCNGLVCLAVWMTYGSRNTAGKILAIVFPITAFVAASFEHSVANMYFVPYALLIKVFDPAFAVAKSMDLTALTWGAFFLKNLLPVTIGNVIGGGVLVAAAYWFIYLREWKK